MGVASVDILLSAFELEEEELNRLLDRILAAPDFPDPRRCIAVPGNECAQSKIDRASTFPGFCPHRNISTEASCVFTPPPDCSDAAISKEFVCRLPKTVY